MNEILKPVTHIDLGWSEDTYNNFMIDMYLAMKKPRPATAPKYPYIDTATGEVKESDTPVYVTIQLKKENHCGE